MKTSGTRNEILTRNPPVPEPESPLFVASFAKALRVLYAFGGNEARLSATEIARRSGLGPSAAQRFIFTLVTLGLLEKDERTRQYRLSARLLDFAYLFLRLDPLSAVAFSHLEALAHATGEHVNLSILDRADVIYILRVPGRARRQQPSFVGGRMPSFCTSNGRVLLAALPREEASRIVATCDRRPLTEFTLAAPAAIMQKVEEARAQGFALVDEESERGVVSIAAPVADGTGRVVAALSMPLAKGTWDAAAAVERVLPGLQRSAQELGWALAGVDL